MSPISKIGVLALASAVLAVPHSNQHRHLHKRAAPPAYGEDASSADPVASSAPPAYGSGSSSSYAAPASSSGAPDGYGSSSYASGSSAAPASSSAPPYPIPSSSSGYSFGTGISSSSYAYSTGVSSSECAVPSTTLIWKSSSLVVPVYGGSSSAPAVPASSAGAGSSAAGSYSDPAVPASSAGAGSSAAGSYSAPYVPASSGAVPTGGYGGGAGGDPACPADTTVTTKVYETVTVTASGYASSSAAPVSSAAPASSAIPEYEGPVQKYGGPGSWGWDDTTTSEAAPATSAPAATSKPAASSYAAGGSSSAVASSEGPAPTYSGGGGFRGKRGLAYNDVELCDDFLDSGSVGWAFNWVQESGGLSDEIVYIPELHVSDDPYFTENWMSNAQKAIDSGAEYLFSLNEPDMPTQANLLPEDAVTAWKKYMEPFAGKAKLVAPSVTNGVGEGLGQDWLKQFLELCSDCTIDAFNQHWYNSPGNDVDYFKEQVGEAVTNANGKPVFVGEFGAIGSESDISSFLEEVMPWMDAEEGIIGYAYFKVGEGSLNSGDGLSSIGETYCNA